MKKSDEKVVWSRNETWALVNCLEGKEILWNFALKDYQNKVKKEAAFAEVAEEIKTKSVGAVKKKLHALRSQHCGERMKMKKKKSGSGTDDNYKPKWEFFTALNFMFKDAGSAGSLVDSMEDVNTETDIDDAANGPSTLSSDDIGTDDETIFAVPQPPKLAKPKIKPKRKRETEEDPHLQLAYSILQAPMEKEDSTALFGKYVAEKLNQFDAYTKAVLTHKINNIIFETELSTISNYTTPSSSQSSVSSPSPTRNSSSSPLPQYSHTYTSSDSMN